MDRTRTGRRGVNGCGRDMAAMEEETRRQWYGMGAEARLGSIGSRLRLASQKRAMHGQVGRDRRGAQRHNGLGIRPSSDMAGGGGATGWSQGGKWHNSGKAVETRAKGNDLTLCVFVVFCGDCVNKKIRAIAPKVRHASERKLTCWCGEELRERNQHINEGSKRKEIQQE